MTNHDYLSPTSVRQEASEVGLAPVVVEQLVGLAERIAANPALCQCAEQHYANAYQKAGIVIEPSAETLLGEEANKLYLLLTLEATRQLRAAQQQHGIPEAITRESYGALPMSARRFAEWNGGKVGLEEWVFRYWFAGVVATGELYRLGRLEYMLQPFEGNLRLYRHKKSGQVLALAEEGVRYRADGYLPFAYDEASYGYYGWQPEEPLPTDWVATLSEDEQTVTGNPISSYGYALPSLQQLDKAEWDMILRNGDTILDMHIPNHMPLRLDLLQTSLQRALEFFRRYHPTRPFKAFACSSWIFNTQWQEMLQADSNLLAFQRQGYLFPLPSDGCEGTYFIFGKSLVDLATAAQETQLQRAVIAHLRAGGKLRNGGFLLLPEDVGKFGQKPYRTGLAE